MRLLPSMKHFLVAVLKEEVEVDKAWRKCLINSFPKSCPISPNHSVNIISNILIEIEDA